MTSLRLNPATTMTGTNNTSSTTTTTATATVTSNYNGSDNEYGKNLIDLFERNYCIFDHLVTFLDEVALFNLEEATKIDSLPLPLVSASTSPPMYRSSMSRRRCRHCCPYCSIRNDRKRRRNHRMSLLCWDQWHKLAQIDTKRTIPRWRPILDDDEQLVQKSVVTTLPHTHHPASEKHDDQPPQPLRPPLQPPAPPPPASIPENDDDDNNNCTTCRVMMVDRIRGRDFARNAIFVHSCEEAQQLAVKKRYDVKTQDDDDQHDRNHQTTATNQSMESTASHQPQIPCDSTIPHDQDRKSTTTRSLTETKRQTPSSISTRSSPSSSSSIHPVPSWSFDFEKCWHEWFEATRSPYGGSCGTYAFVRVTIIDDDIMKTTKTIGKETEIKPQQHHRRYWEGFRRLIWASWMDRVILDVHLVDLVQEVMGYDEELDKVLKDGGNHHNHSSSSPHLLLKKLLDALHVTVVVSGSLLVVTGGVNVGGTTGFVFCRPSNKDDRSSSWNGTSGAPTSWTDRNETVISQSKSPSPLPTMTAIPVKLSPDTFNHEVNIQVGMHPDEDFTV